MGMTRKKFLSMVSSGLALAAARPARLLAASEAAITFSAEFFRPFINTTFSVHRTGGVARLNLDGILFGPTQPETEQFSLVFSGPARTQLAEGTYNITHPGLTPVDLHISPAGMRSDNRKLFRADFDILKTA